LGARDEVAFRAREIFTSAGKDYIDREATRSGRQAAEMKWIIAIVAMNAGHPFIARSLPLDAYSYPSLEACMGDLGRQKAIQHDLSIELGAAAFWECVAVDFGKSGWTSNSEQR
jgi:hypothetical protein